MDQGSSGDDHAVAEVESETRRPWNGVRILSLVGAILVGGYGFASLVPFIVELVTGDTPDVGLLGVIIVSVYVLWALVAVVLFRRGLDRQAWWSVAVGWVVLILSFLGAAFLTAVRN